MKPLSVIGSVLLASVFCSFVCLNTKLKPSPRILSQSPPAITFTSNEFINVTEFVDIPCAAESVILEGQLHVLTHFTVTGNNVVAKSHLQPQGITGIGSVSGNRYHSTGVTQEIFKGSFSNGQYATTMVNNFRVIGQGPGNNFIVHATFHLTLNAAGIATATVDNLRMECK